MVDFRDLDNATRAKQLGNPEGEIGIAVADFMNVSNAKVSEAAFRRLAPRAKERVLEIGFGNGKLLPGLLALAPGLRYAGLDISETMVNAARANNRAAVEAGEAEFILGACERMPFEDQSFERAVTVNTIYFWPEPTVCLAELKRVLKPGGSLVVASMNRATAERYPFTVHGFRIYDEDELKAFYARVGLRDVSIELYRETVPTARGATIEREYFLTLGRA
jgi:ubiquinone/menaquinone biosynthesis C-methylase UbiE